MGSATREAIANVTTALAAFGSKADLATAEDIFAVGRVLAHSVQLRSVFSDPAAGGEAKSELARTVFAGQISPVAMDLVDTMVNQRWSGHRDLLQAIEETGIRAAAATAPKGVSVESEIFEFATIVGTDTQLELALSSSLAETASKSELVDRLLGGVASKQTTTIVREVVSLTRGRSIREALAHAADVVADQSGLTIAIVTSATPLSAAQLKRIGDRLSSQFGKKLSINQIVDPAILGGLRIQVGAEVIDGTVATRINDLRLRLAG